MTVKTIGERIKEIRTENNMTLEKFGERLGMQKSAISKWERGENNIPEQMIKSICREFDINEDWLRNGTGPKKPELDMDIEYGRICAELGITDQRAKKIIMNYAKFTPEDKQLFWSYIDTLLQE